MNVLIECPLVRAFNPVVDYLHTASISLCASGFSFVRKQKLHFEGRGPKSSCIKSKRHGVKGDGQKNSLKAAPYFLQAKWIVL